MGFETEEVDGNVVEDCRLSTNADYMVPFESTSRHLLHLHAPSLEHFLMGSRCIVRTSGWEVVVRRIYSRVIATRQVTAIEMHL
jgi:hypothetical protein